MEDNNTKISNKTKLYNKNYTQKYVYRIKTRKRIIKPTIMRRLIYDMYYADEISKDIAGKLLDKLTQLRDKRRSRW